MKLFNNNSFRLWIIAILLSLFYALLCTGAIGCTTANKATGYMKKHPEVGAQYCATTFPPRDSIGEAETIFIDAENEDHTAAIDSLQHLVDSLNTDWTEVVNGATDEVQLVFRREIIKNQKEIVRLKEVITSLKAAYKPCKPDTVKLTNTVYRVNTAKEYLCEADKAALTAELEKSDGKATHRLAYIWKLWAAIILLLVWYNRKLLLKLILKRPV
ncbi:MAG: hypothetical protein EOO14_00335 [Chitinophagaceae bacterium]|nr:MAG: hypothetical protein EOO14_00335 [Chitinophagaceae bacterium]